MSPPIKAQDGAGDAYHFAIETLAGGLVGGLGTHDCNPRNGTSSLGIGIRPENWWRGYAAEAITLALRYYFAELRYQKFSPSSTASTSRHSVSSRASVSPTKVASGG